MISLLIQAKKESLTTNVSMLVICGNLRQLSLDKLLLTFAWLALLSAPSANVAKARTVNGCGDDTIAGRLVPNQPVGVDFRPSCDNHDRCYSHYGPNTNSSTHRLHCDRNFLEDLKSACDRELLNPTESPVGTVITLGTGGTALAACKSVAALYYSAVRERGGEPYWDAQRKAKATYQKQVPFIVEILTADVPLAGTDATAFIMLEGDQGTTPYLKLDNPGRDDNNRGSLSIFKVRSSINPGQIRSIVIKHNNNNDEPGWLISRLTIKNQKTGQSELFEFGEHWLSRNAAKGRSTCARLWPSRGGSAKVVNLGIGGAPLCP